MATTLNSVKTRINQILNQLVRADILADVQSDDFKRNILDRDYSRFPVAIVTTPSIESASETNQHNKRTYTFEIVVISKAEEVVDATQIEDLVENILNKFDNDPTLKGDESTGIADGGVLPTASAPQAITSGGRQYVVFSVVIRARALQQLTYV